MVKIRIMKESVRMQSFKRSACCYYCVLLLKDPHTVGFHTSFHRRREDRGLRADLLQQPGALPSPLWTDTWRSTSVLTL